MAIQQKMQKFLILISAFLFVFNYYTQTIQAQVSIPAKFDGFIYEDRKFDSDSIIIEAFFDPVCPDSRDSWPPLKQVLDYYGSHLYLVVHPFALPYHDNAFATSRALHIANKLNSSATYHLLEQFFKYQEKFYNQQTHYMSRAFIVDQLVKFTAEAIGNSLLSAVESGFNDRQTDLVTRTSFKYGCSRGVIGTPYFFVNGFPLPDAGSAIDYNGWRSIIDPLIGAQGSEMMQRRLGGCEELPVCPKPRRLGAAIPDFLKLPFKCHKHSQSNVEGRSEVLNMIAGKSDEGRESLCSGCYPPCYSGSPPGRADNPLVHDAQFVNQMVTVHANQVFR